MTQKEILESLCFYDKRNPYCVFDDEEELIQYKKENIQCFCDNCFHGKTKLAEELVKLLEK